jgi:hypothetical protein
MHDGGEQVRLVIEAVIESALRDACARRYGFNGCRAVTRAEKYFSRNFQDSLAQLQRVRTRGSAATARLKWRGCAALTDGDN